MSSVSLAVHAFRMHESEGVLRGIGRGAQGTGELGGDGAGGQWPGRVGGEDGGVK